VRLAQRACASPNSSDVDASTAIRRLAHPGWAARRDHVSAFASAPQSRRNEMTCSAKVSGAGEVGDVRLLVEDADPRVGERCGDDLGVSLDILRASDQQQHGHGDFRCQRGVEGLRSERAELSGNGVGRGHARRPGGCRPDAADLLLGHHHQVVVERLQHLLGPALRKQELQVGHRLGWNGAVRDVRHGPAFVEHQRRGDAGGEPTGVADQQVPARIHTSLPNWDLHGSGGQTAGPAAGGCAESRR